MTRLYQLMSELQFSRCSKPVKYKKLLFALCFFHSVLLERKKFLQLGWNIIYGFNDSDFEVRPSPNPPWEHPPQVGESSPDLVMARPGDGAGTSPHTGVRELAESLPG